MQKYKNCIIQGQALNIKLDLKNLAVPKFCLRVYFPTEQRIKANAKAQPVLPEVFPVKK